MHRISTTSGKDERACTVKANDTSDCCFNARSVVRISSRLRYDWCHRIYAHILCDSPLGVGHYGFPGCVLDIIQALHYFSHLVLYSIELWVKISDLLTLNTVNEWTNWSIYCQTCDSFSCLAYLRSAKPFNTTAEMSSYIESSLMVDMEIHLVVWLLPLSLHYLACLVLSQEVFIVHRYKQIPFLV